MPASSIYIGGTKYWLYGSYSDRDTRNRIAKHLRTRYHTKTFFLTTESFWGNYPLFHLYTNKVRKVWS